MNSYDLIFILISELLKEKNSESDEKAEKAD